MPSPDTISTASKVVKVRTARGVLSIGPHGKLSGLWKIARAELRSAGEVRAMCAGAGKRGRESRRQITWRTLQHWREHQEFPAPVLNIGGLDLWSRTEVEEWLAARDDD